MEQSAAANAPVEKAAETATTTTSTEAVAETGAKPLPSSYCGHFFEVSAEGNGISFDFRNAGGHLHVMRLTVIEDNKPVRVMGPADRCQDAAILYMRARKQALAAG